jgi:Zn-dependent peptidase ImmA (M78 family)
MSKLLKIEHNWLGRDVGGDLGRAFYADIGISVGDEYLTRLEDSGASTVRNYLRASAYQLAVWFAANWWRLRWEPEIQDWRKNPDWRMSHSMASVGGGFVWPNIQFMSVGDSMEIASLPSKRATAIEPVRYLNRINEHISATEFEQKVDAFLEAVLSRLQSLSIHEETLAGVWTKVLAERRDAELSRRRKLEAICGYDPDEAPDELLRMLVENGATLGFAALEEVAAAGRHLSAEVLQEILNLTKSGASSTQGGFRGVLPTINATPADAEDELPWQIGEKLARLARSQWCFDDKPITDSDLADLLQVPAKVFEDGEKCPISIPVALRTEEADTFDIYFDSPRNANRRFAIARLLGDHLRMNDRLLPATKAKTARQKIQRTFAQEFLCPIDALLAKIQTDQPDDLDLDEAAAYFKVSPLLVRATLVNKGYLDRESLNVPA